MTNMNR